MAERIPPFDYVDEVMAEVYRNMKAEERLEAALEMWRSARQMLFEALRSFHPEWTDAQVDRQVAERLLRGSA